MQNNLISLAKPILIYGIGGIIGRLLSILLVPLYTRLLTPADYGILDIATTVTQLLVPALILGLEAAVPFYYYDTPDHRSRKSLITTAFLFRIIFAIIICGLLLLGINKIASLIFGASNGKTEFVYLLQIVIVTLPFSITVMFYQSLFRAQQYPWRFAVISLLHLFIIISLNLYFVAWLKLGVVGVLWSNLIAGVVLSLVGLVIIRSDLVLSFSFRWLRQLLTYGLPLIPVSMAYWVLAYADRYFLLQFRGLTEIGLYSIGNKLSAFLILFSGAFQLAWPPFAFAIMKEPKANQIYAKVFLLYLMVMMCLAVTISIFASEILLIFTTSAYIDSYKVVGLLCLGVVANGSFYIVGVGLSISKKTHHFAWISVIAAVLNVTLNIVFIPQFGIIGAAVTTALSFSFSTFVVYIFAQKYYFIPYEISKIGYVCLIGITLILLSLILDTIVPGTTFGPLLLIGKVAMLLLFPGLLLGSKIVRIEDVRKAFSLVSSEIWNNSKIEYKKELSLSKLNTE